MTADKAALLDWQHYMDKTRFKTASLIAHSAKAVAILGGAAPPSVAAAYAYGQHLGLAFQLTDDVLARTPRPPSTAPRPQHACARARPAQDFTGTASVLGKPALSDLRSGLATAPVLFAVEEFPEELRPLVQRKFKEEGDVEAARAAVERSRGIERTRELAATHAAQAADAVRSFPPTTCRFAAQARRALIELAASACDRKK